MASKNRVTIPRVPRGLDRELSTFLEGIREQTEILGGKQRGDSLDRAITFRDWREANGSLNLSALGLLNGDSDGEFFDDPSPLKPTGVEFFPAFETVLATWDRMRRYDWYYATEVWRQTIFPHDSDIIPLEDDLPTDFDKAVLAGSTSSPYFTDYVPPATRFVYWVRHVNRDGGVGPMHDATGSVVETYARPIDVLREYSKEVYQSEQYKWLQSSVGMMDAIHRAYNLAGLGDDNILVQNLLNADSLSDLLAEQSLSGMLDAHVSSNEIKAQFGKNYARLSGGVTAAVSANESVLARISSLETQYDGVDGLITAKIDEFDLAISSSTGAISTSIDTYTVSYNGVDVSLQQLAEVVANADGVYQAQWGIKTEVDGLQGGVGFYNDGTITSFMVYADRFTITSGEENDEGIVPFAVVDGKTLIKEALIDSAAIYNLIASNITAERLVSTISIESPLISGGSIFGTTLNIGDGNTTIDALGLLQTRNAFIQGHIDADSGTLNNVTIAETCTVEGTLSAKNIEGDIIDRTVVIVDGEFVVSAGYTCTLIEGDILPGVLGAEFDRTLVLSGMSFDHENGGGSSSRFSVYLLLDGVEQQRFYSVNVGEEGSVTPCLACAIPQGTSTKHFELILEPDGNDNILVQQSAITADVFKRGESIKNVNALEIKATPGGGGTQPPEQPPGRVF